MLQDEIFTVDIKFDTDRRTTMKINVMRLVMMRDLMNQIQEDKDMLSMFNLNNWMTVERKEMLNYLASLEEVTPSCGFTACACGWAGVTKSFNDLGFWTKAGTSFYTDAPKEVVNKAVKKFDDDDHLSALYICEETFREGGYFFYTEFAAACRFFGLEMLVADYLFLPDAYDLETLRQEERQQAPHLDYDFPEDMKIEVTTDEYGDVDIHIDPKHVVYRIDLLLGGS